MTTSWPSFLEQRFGAHRAVARSWALWRPSEAETDWWRGFPIEPLQPWLVATLHFDARNHPHVFQWHSGPTLQAFLANARTPAEPSVRVDDDDAAEVSDEVAAALKGAPVLGSGGDVRIDFDGRLLRMPAPPHSATTYLIHELLQRNVEPVPGALRDLVRAMFADDAKRDDDVREDLAQLTRDVIDQHWATMELPRASAPPINLVPPVMTARRRSVLRTLWSALTKR